MQQVSGYPWLMRAIQWSFPAAAGSLLTSGDSKASRVVVDDGVESTSTDDDISPRLEEMEQA